MYDDRRRARSSRAVEALALYLDASRRELSLRALTLGEADGELLFGSGEDVERIARLGAVVDAGVCLAPEVATWRTTLGGERVVVTSWGGRLPPDVVDGVRRILLG